MENSKLFIYQDEKINNHNTELQRRLGVQNVF